MAPLRRSSNAPSSPVPVTESRRLRRHRHGFPLLTQDLAIGGEVLRGRLFAVPFRRHRAARRGRPSCSPAARTRTRANAARFRAARSLPAYCSSRMACSIRRANRRPGPYIRGDAGREAGGSVGFDSGEILLGVQDLLRRNRRPAKHLLEGYWPSRSKTAF